MHNQPQVQFSRGSTHINSFKLRYIFFFDEEEGGNNQGPRRRNSHPAYRGTPYGHRLGWLGWLRLGVSTSPPPKKKPYFEGAISGLVLPLKEFLRLVLGWNPENVTKTDPTDGRPTPNRHQPTPIDPTRHPTDTSVPRASIDHAAHERENRGVNPTHWAGGWRVYGKTPDGKGVPT